ncbi:cytochrome P450 2J3-like isoform X2 [Pseudopipra pipra]|uniref:cytochrome P450 2J3-like isoform X2 n=1 Tax=Pseudopipra pipra TaxID=415032 RepID=UPI0031394AD3
MLHFLWDSISFHTLLIFLIVFLLVADYMKNRNPKNFPPTPLRLPFLGHIYMMDFKAPHITVQKYTKKYGDIFGMSMGSMKLVVVNGMRLVKEVLVNQGDNFLDRPEIPMDMFSKIGNPFNPQFTLTNAVSNVICSLTLGNRFDYHDEDFQKLLKLMHETVFLQGAITTQLYNSFPSIMKFLPGAHQTISKNWKSLKSYMQEQINKHKEDWNPSESRDYIDSYLQEIAKDKGSDTFREEHLVACTLDLMFAGTETTSSTLRWALLFMALHPEIQARVQAEIDAVIGQARQPVLEDRNNMPYTNAVIHEVQRKANIVPFSMPRVAAKDTILDGFFIPKGTVLTINITSVMFDKNEWETPNTFNPGHFLKDGKFWKRESFLAFSMGKRACLGEVLARSELFLFFTSLLQKFTFQAPPDTTLSLQPLMGITMAPQPYKICAVPR